MCHQIYSQVRRCNAHGSTKQNTCHTLPASLSLLTGFGLVHETTIRRRLSKYSLFFLARRKPLLSKKGGVVMIWGYFNSTRTCESRLFLAFVFFFLSVFIIYFQGLFFSHKCNATLDFFYHEDKYLKLILFMF